MHVTVTAAGKGRKISLLSPRAFLQHRSRSKQVGESPIPTEEHNKSVTMFTVLVLFLVRLVIDLCSLIAVEES